MKVEAGVASGPEIGEKLPDFTLNDQWGEALHFADIGKKALVLFHRSASW